MGTVTEKWLKWYVEGNQKGKPREIANVEQMEYVRENRGSNQSSLGMGWAIPIRNCRRLNDRLQTFLNKLFNDGERTGNKLTAEEVFQEMRNKFSFTEYLPVGTIRSYFSRRASQFRTGKINLDDDIDCEIGEDNYELQMEDIECDRERAVITTVEGVECQPDLQKDEWVAVAYETNWFPGQFIQADKETKEVEIHFLHRSATCKSWFIWPELSSNGNEDKTWVEDYNIFGCIVYSLLCNAV